MTKFKLTERKFTASELKQLNSNKYLLFKCTRKKVINGNKTDVALFSLRDSIISSEHHTVGITPVYVKESCTPKRNNRVTAMGYNGLKVVVTMVGKDTTLLYSQIGAPTVKFTTQSCNIADALAMAMKLANAQQKLLLAMPDNAVRVGKPPKVITKYTV